MLHKILDELDIHADDSLFIGDGPRDEMASKKAEIEYRLTGALQIIVML